MLADLLVFTPFIVAGLVALWAVWTTWRHGPPQ